MNFGKIDPQLLHQVDLTLPNDHPATIQLLNGSRIPDPQFFIGCSSWGLKDWIGTLYPKGLPSGNFLTHYAQFYNTVEVSSLFYGLPSNSQFEKWAAAVGPHFRFCPKFPETITHIKRLKNVELELQHFIDALNILGDKLGPVFFMPHPSLGKESLTNLLEFITQLPDELQVFTELRNSDWYASPHHDWLFDTLQSMSRGVVITDTAGKREVIHMHLTTKEAFIRFVGNDLHPTDFQRIDDWVQRLKKWLAGGLEKCYFFIHQHEEKNAPILIRYLIDQLNEQCALDIPQKPFVHEGGLFG